MTAGTRPPRHRDRRPGYHRRGQDIRPLSNAFRDRRCAAGDRRRRADDNGHRWVADLRRYRRQPAAGHTADAAESARPEAGRRGTGVRVQRHPNGRTRIAVGGRRRGQRRGVCMGGCTAAGRAALGFGLSANAPWLERITAPDRHPLPHYPIRWPRGGTCSASAPPRNSSAPSRWHSGHGQRSTPAPRCAHRSPLRTSADVQPVQGAC